ncbi:hypothetical protein Trydic_g2743 [Trypoxylus dichotomus]
MRERAEHAAAGFHLPIETTRQLIRRARRDADDRHTAMATTVTVGRWNAPNNLLLDIEGKTLIHLSDDMVLKDGNITKGNPLNIPKSQVLGSVQANFKKIKSNQQLYRLKKYVEKNITNSNFGSYRSNLHSTAYHMILTNAIVKQVSQHPNIR